MSSRHILYSLLLHLAAAGLLIVSFDIAPRPIAMPPPSADVVSAVTVDSKQVDAELNRLKDQEKQKREKELKRLQNLQDKARQAEKKRKAEEKQRTQEQQRLAALKKQQAEVEKQSKAAEEKKRQAEAERKRAEEAKRKAEMEAQRLADAKRKAEEEQKQKANEEALQKQLAEEEKAHQAAQSLKDQQLLKQYVAYMRDAIRRQFNIVGLPSGLSCVLVIHTIPTGDVVGVEVEKSSGNDVFDRRAEVAVKKAAPLPVPDDANTFERLQMREIRIEFAPQE